MLAYPNEGWHAQITLHLGDGQPLHKLRTSHAEFQLAWALHIDQAVNYWQTRNDKGKTFQSSMRKFDGSYSCYSSMVNWRGLKLRTQLSWCSNPLLPCQAIHPEKMLVHHAVGALNVAGLLMIELPNFDFSYLKGQRITLGTDVDEAGHRKVEIETLAKTCACCSRTKATGATSMRTCAGCNLVYYCSEECQKLHWKAHKSTCRSAVVDAHSCVTSASYTAKDP